MDVFHQPGQCDLTANVDFAYLKEAMEDLGASTGLFSMVFFVSYNESVSTHGPIPQGAFLTGMGLEVRMDALVKSAKNEERCVDIQNAAQRLIDPVGMGKEYNVLGITSTGITSTDTVENTSKVWPFVRDSGSG